MQARAGMQSQTFLRPVKLTADAAAPWSEAELQSDARQTDRRTDSPAPLVDGIVFF